MSFKPTDLKKMFPLYLGLTPMQRLECESTGVYPNRLQWITDAMWKQCQYLEGYFTEPYSQLCSSLLKCQEQWDEFLKSEDPYKLMASTWDGQYNQKSLNFYIQLFITTMFILFMIHCSLPVLIYLQL